MNYVKVCSNKENVAEVKILHTVHVFFQRMSFHLHMWEFKSNSTFVLVHVYTLKSIGKLISHSNHENLNSQQIQLQFPREKALNI